MINFLKKIFYQPRRPFSITAPIAYEINQSFWAKIMGIKPLSSIMYVIPNWRNKFSHLDINERVVENPFVFQYLPKSLNKKILDIGCCETTLPIQIASLGFDVMGIDMRSYKLSHPNFIFRQEDICQTKLKPKQFDVITCISTLEHIGLNTIYGESNNNSSDKKAISQINKLLKNNGKLLLTVPAANKFQQTNFMKIYTPEKLHLILKNFKIIHEKYYAPNLIRSQWSPCSSHRLPSPFNFGVATIVAVKQPDLANNF